MNNSTFGNEREEELLLQLESNPNSLEVYNKLFEFYTGAGLYAKAVACFRKITDLYDQVPLGEYIRLSRYFYSNNYISGVDDVLALAKSRFSGNITLYNELLGFYKASNNSERLRQCYAELLESLESADIECSDLSFPQIPQGGYVFLAGKNSFSDILLMILRLNRPDIKYVGKIDFAEDAVDIPSSNIYAFSGWDNFSAKIHGVITCAVDAEETKSFLAALYRYKQEHESDYTVVSGPTLEDFLEELGINQSVKFRKIYEKCSMSLIYGFLNPAKKIAKLADMNLDTELLKKVSCIDPGETEPQIAAEIFPYIPASKRRSLKVVSMFHKPYPFFDTDIHLQLHCGRKIAEEKSKDGVLNENEHDWMHRYTIGDDTGDNISYLNRYFCEMTGIYWLWKNYDKIGNPEYLGTQHYRRIFYCTCKPWLFDVLSKYDMILPNRGNSWVSSEEEFEEGREYYYDYEFIKKNSPQYLESFRYHMTHSEFFAGNMFICRKDLFFEYCEFIFPVLFNLHENIDYAAREAEIIAEGGSQVETRIMKMYRRVGYHAEHLTTAFIFHQLQKGVKTLEQHIMSLS